jgi:hypothetical protein
VASSAERRRTNWNNGKSDGAAQPQRANRTESENCIESCCVRYEGDMFPVCNAEDKVCVEKC